MQLGRLLVHMLSPAHPSQERKQIFEIVREPNHQEILRDCLSPSLQVSTPVLHEQQLLYNYTNQELNLNCIFMPNTMNIVF